MGVTGRLRRAKTVEWMRDLLTRVGAYRMQWWMRRSMRHRMPVRPSVCLRKIAMTLMCVLMSVAWTGFAFARTTLPAVMMDSFAMALTSASTDLVAGMQATLVPERLRATRTRIHVRGVSRMRTARQRRWEPGERVVVLAAHAVKQASVRVQ